MTYEQQFDLWQQYAQINGFKRNIYQLSPLEWIIRKLGYKPPPIIFWQFSSVAAILGGQFGSAWGLFMYYLRWHEEGLPIYAAILASAGAGLFFGAFMALYIRRRRKKLGLPGWQEFLKSQGWG